MKSTLKNRQHLVFVLMLGVSALIAILGYHGLRKDMVLFRKAEQLLAGKDFRGAIPLYVASFKHGNSSPNLLKSLGDACRGAGSSLAIDTYRLYLNQFPADRAVRISLARSLAWQGRYDEAAIEYRKILGENR